MSPSNYQTLIAVHELQALQSAGTACVLLDCGFDLADPAAGERAHAAGHLPGAHCVHLDRDLAGAKTGADGSSTGSSSGSGSRGRHPLPDFSDFAARAGGWGIGPGTQVVCHDDQGGIYAARAWWLLRWLGHAEVAVLDGGRAAWLHAGGTLQSSAPTGAAKPPYPTSQPAMPTVDAAALQRLLGRALLLDARAPERFRGEVEPLDPVAGHIPGASNRFFKLNLAADGRFKPAAQLREEFQQLGSAADVVHQCGSGVTACHNLLAMAHAGLQPGALYPGSWSEWCSDPARPVARG